MKMWAIMRRTPIIRPTMIQKNPGMILHGRDIIQYKKDGHIGQCHLVKVTQRTKKEGNDCCSIIIVTFFFVSLLLSITNRQIVHLPD